ncbi:MAG: hypothetical protein HYU97_10725 [Deltaproteobacteria bacterium]|nr:hypothetical protein [Deltaproteobacteria bacterium]
MSPSPSSTNTKNGGPPTAGYPRIERLVETEQFEELNESFGKVYQELEKISQLKSGLGKGKLAAKAMKAIDLTTELFKELLKIKYQMVEMADKAKDPK